MTPLRMPRDFIGISQYFSSTHKGIDLGWNSAHGGKTAPVYAAGDGEVIFVQDGMGNSKTGGSGNHIIIKHEDNVYTVYCHLSKGLLVKKGDKVKQHQMIGRMGNSGASNGYHLHFGVFIGGTSPKYAVDPVKYVYAYPDDVLGKNSQGVQRYIPEDKFVITVTDLTAAQAEAVLTQLEPLHVESQIEKIGT